MAYNNLKVILPTPEEMIDEVKKKILYVDELKDRKVTR